MQGLPKGKGYRIIATNTSHIMFHQNQFLRTSLKNGKEDKAFTDNLIENVETIHKLNVDLLEDTQDTWIDDFKSLISELYG